LTPEDREIILDRIKDRLKNRPDDDWVLVATSCVETGLDFSFRYGFREIAGLLNVLQFLGRIRRNNEVMFFDSMACVFELLRPDYPQATDFTKNPDVANAAVVFRRLARKYESLGPEHCDIAIEQEIDLNTPAIQVAGQSVTWKGVMGWVKKSFLRKIHDNCRVIPQDKITVIPQVKYNELMAQFEEKQKQYGENAYLDKTDIVRKSFQYYSNKASQSPFIVPIVGGPLDGFFRWTGDYDPDFLGYAAQRGI
jgi:CRISPR/Cas system-associated endonuclease/helicase Cas3